MSKGKGIARANRTRTQVPKLTRKASKTAKEVSGIPTREYAERDKILDRLKRHKDS